METSVEKLYPSVAAVLGGTSFHKDWAKAVALAVSDPTQASGLTAQEQEEAARQSEKRFIAACRQGRFKSTTLISILGTPALTSIRLGASLAQSIEDDLNALIEAVGVDPIKMAFAKKLINDIQFEDVRYEIGIAATALEFFDPNTMSFEEELAGSGKNSDLCGNHLGKRCRIEVKVIHENWPPTLDEDVESRLNSVQISTGYSVLLRQPVKFDGEVEEVCDAIQVIFDRRNEVTESGLEIGIWSVFPGAEPDCFLTDGGPLSEVRFYPAEPEFRLVTPPAGSRAMMDPNEWKEIKERNPKEVITLADIKQDPRTHKETPLSTVIWQRLDEKRKQCEEGVINIVAVGIPLPADARSVEDAVTGAIFLSVPVHESGDQDDHQVHRTSSGPFVPAKYSKDTQSLVDPFRIISTVWAIRLTDTAPQSCVFRNPNATQPLNRCSAKWLELLGRARCELRSIQFPPLLRMCMAIRRLCLGVVGILRRVLA